MNARAVGTKWKRVSKGSTICTESSAKFETELFILNQHNIYDGSQKIMGQNLSECKSAQLYALALDPAEDSVLAVSF